MKKSRFSDVQIVGLLKQAEADVAVKEQCRRVARRLLLDQLDPTVLCPAGLVVV